MIKELLKISKEKRLKGILQFAYCRLFFRDRVDLKKYIDALKGKRGLEIGGPSSIFRDDGQLPLYREFGGLDSCNFGKETIWEGKIEEGRTYNYYKDKKGKQFICDGTDLGAIPSQTYDFLISSHCLEHIANPLKAMSEWLRVLKDNGILLIVAPHKDGTFDHKRPAAKFEHILEDHKNNVQENDLSHLEEILRLHDLSKDPGAGDYDSFKKRSMKNLENRALHQHAFNTELLLRIFDHFGTEIVCCDVVFPYHIIVMGRKLNKGGKPNNEAFLNSASDFRYFSPFPSDHI